MAAYAALVSLMHTLNSIQNHPRFSTFLDKSQSESLTEKLDFLLEFMESGNSHGDARKEAVEDLETLIASAAYAAEDVIESHLVNQIGAGSSDKGSISSLDLKKLIEEFDSVVVKIKEVKEAWRFKEEQLVYSKPANSSRPVTTVETHMVGLDGYLSELLDVLTGQQPDRQIIPIVGIGGIGKTTLARYAFENSRIMQHFDVRAWVNVSQYYNLRQIPLEILSSLGESTSELDERTEDELGKRLYKKLFGRRYLIVLDDVWDYETWDKIEFFIPDNYNRSRIIVTTRVFKLANHFGSLGLVVDLLDDNQSWALLRNKVFAEKDCPVELEEIGKAIVRKCKGLPLSISVIGGLLQKSSRTQEFWESIAESISTIRASEKENPMDILSLSYTHLPAHLKPCFLYLGVFPEEQEIRVSLLTKLWVAEGFIKPSSHKILEDVAEDYLKNLIDRNLVLARRLRSNGKLKTCKMHDLLRDFCIRVAEKEMFLCVKEVFDNPQDKNWEPRIISQGSTAENSQLLHTMESTPLARTIICDSRAMISYKSRLRVLTEVHGDTLDTTFQQVNSRFLAFKSTGASVGWIHAYNLPSSISQLWNLKTLIIDENIDKVVAPPEIWEMPELRHLQFHELYLSDPPPRDDQDDIVLQNLQTLQKVSDFRFSEEVCRRIPNIRRLSILYDDFSGEGEKTSWYDLYNLGNLERLESLKFSFYTVPERNDLLTNLKFPHSLRNLRLEDCELHWSDLSIIDSLPNLEVLKLKHQSARGPKWNTVEGHFSRLKFLEIESCYLIHWNAESSSFPRLEKLVLGGLNKLVEIPPSLGDIPTLESICVVDCSISAAISAAKMLEEQQELGNEDLQVRVSFSEKMKLEEEESSKNDDLQVRVGFSEKMKLEEFMERVELEGFRSNNLHIDGL